MTAARVVLAALCLSLWGIPDASAQSGHPPLGTGFVRGPLELDRALASRPRIDAAMGQEHDLGGLLSYPLYRWPLDRALHDGLSIVNYVDHDASGGVLDYSNGPHAYDGHAGTDYSLFNFRLMDRGCGVRAAAPGTVIFTSGVAPGAFDRSCTFDWPDDGTWIWVQHLDGTYSEYYHLRAWSLTVQNGDPVQAGQLLGLVGSSGYSTGPHLHFETGDDSAGSYHRRDPYTGPVNPLPSLWQTQEDYQGDDPLWFADIGVFTDAAVGGSVFNTTYCDTQEGIQAPAVFGIHEPHVDLWVQFQGQAGDSFRIEIRRPNGSVYASYADALAFDARFDWFWVYWFWDGGVGPADYGTWKAQAYANGALARETPFEVGPATVHGPRLRRAGRSFRVSGAVQRDTLRVTSLSGSVSYSLLNAPAFVTLQDSIVSVAAASTQPTRSLFFQAVATDGAARRDTAWYHLVDMSKPLEPPVAVGEPHRVGPDLHLRAAPNPTRGAAVLEYVLAHAGHVEVTLLDVFGRRVRRLTSGERAAGRHHASWDGRDEDGRLAASGLYLARITCDGAHRTVRVVVAH